MSAVFSRQCLAGRSDHLGLAAPHGIEIDQEEARARREGNSLLHAQLGIEQVYQPATDRLGFTSDRFVQTRRENVRPAPQQQVIRLAPLKLGVRETNYL